MTSFVQIEKRLIPVQQIAMFEPFVAPTEQPLQTDKNFKTRVTFLNRMSRLSEETIEQLAKANKFRLLPLDQVAINPDIAFQIEAFEPSKGFQPTRPFVSRLIWFDQDGNSQSKLLLTPPEEVAAVLAKREVGNEPNRSSGRSGTAIPPRRRGSRGAALAADEPS